ncbi:hypothetical protein MKW94_005775 [Papaver nudicaule]|uniref:Uncharacterized protein n=1 Tax=Papaver nudicaule TaxID=74823 RepID=A0AA41VEF7_PAPNU|nr:hypothetical protein [Papaver nudicaule]
MVTYQASKLNFLSSSNSCSKEVIITSLLFEPSSQSLALMHSDSSILLFPSFSPFSSSDSPNTNKTLIPPYCSSSCFLRIQSNPNSTEGRAVFIVASPDNGGSRVLLRLWVLQKNQVFVQAKVNCNLKLDTTKSGCVVDLAHGFTVKLVGSVNFFALHSVTARKIWVFGAKFVDGDESVKLMKCAVIDCILPISSITMSLGFLIFGEDNGVRVFPLRPLVKGRVKKVRDSGRRRGGSENGLNNDAFGCHGVKSNALEGTTEIASHDYTKKIADNSFSVKHKILKLKQDSGLGGSFFVDFKGVKMQSQILKAVSVQALLHKRFLILDSVGDLHLLSMYGISAGSEITGHMRHLGHMMKIQLLVVLPDISTRMHKFWISDGLYTVHLMSISEMGIHVNDTDKHELGEKQMQISAVEAIFASERIQKVVPLSGNTVLVLGQVNWFMLMELAYGSVSFGTQVVLVSSCRYGLMNTELGSVLCNFLVRTKLFDQLKLNKQQV